MALPLLFVGSVARAQSLEIQVADPLVANLILECADGTFQAPVRGGIATMERTPSHCQVYMIRKSGTIGEPGKWSCTLDRCTQSEVLHKPVSDAPGRINIIMTTDLPPSASLELTCTTGYRTRTEVSLNTAVFDGVPAEQCTMFFKGSVPAKFGPISEGTWSCGLSNTVAVCTRR